MNTKGMLDVDGISLGNVDMILNNYKEIDASDIFAVDKNRSSVTTVKQKSGTFSRILFYWVSVCVYLYLLGTFEHQYNFKISY